MFNLIKKDLIILKVQLLLFIPFIVFFAVFATHLSPAFIFLLASIFIPINAYIYDEQAETNILLNSLPYTRQEIVAARYIGAIAYMILSIGVAGIILYLCNYGYTIRDIVIAVGLFFVFSALSFPLFYILKPGYIGLAVFVSFIVLAVVLPPIVQFLAENLTTITNFLTNLSAFTLYLSGATIAIGLYLLSWIFSRTIYLRKDF
ncbi:ABC-2 transporter permease [Oceanobacillus sp. J11TS1]|uniref:ABC-2 transporter permease n=1 Tax=Oceanobacillus sp. J11TS1 TaxID=2807191 RepID=UPI001B046DC7|nr:ABC-2 transporter permease [Oceanobacillus sp. J11TS1]GIO23389.1 permease [Oceanobacillus sp. J11TS1]